jgi:endonuclease/exonuclease/phosphatase family metal-dependent hydrolase
MKRMLDIQGCRSPYFKYVLLIALSLILLGSMLNGVVSAPLQPVLAADLKEYSEVLALENQQKLRVMTYNIRHAKGLDGKMRLERIVRDILDGGADVISLQEVDRRNIRSGFADQIAEIGEELGMYWVFSPSIKVGFMQYGNAIVSKYPLYNDRIWELPGDKENRSVLAARVQLADREVAIVTTHLGVSRADRERQVPMLEDILRGIEGAAIFMGDFNMEADHPLMGWAAEGKWRKAQLEGERKTVLGGKEIDHIFYRGFANAAKAWTMPSEASDHLPVLADFRW